MWDCGTCWLVASQVTTPLERGAASSRASDAPLFLQRLFKGLIDRPRGGRGTRKEGYGACMGNSEMLGWEVERWATRRKTRLSQLVVTTDEFHVCAVILLRDCFFQLKLDRMWVWRSLWVTVDERRQPIHHTVPTYRARRPRRPHSAGWSSRTSPSGSGGPGCCSPRKRSARSPGGPGLRSTWHDG